MLEEKIFIPLLEKALQKHKGQCAKLGRYFSICKMPFGNILLYNHFTEETSAPAHYLSFDKQLTKSTLLEYCVSTPQGDIFDRDQYLDALAYFKSLGKPCVVKPNNSSLGRGVSLDITDDGAFKRAWIFAASRSTGVLIEQMLKGTEYRVFMIEGELIAATERVSPFVIGDGLSSIEELIQEKNGVRLLNPFTANKLIQLDKKLVEKLKGLGYSIKDIPENGERVILNGIQTVFVGGEHYDVTEQVHSGFRQCFKRAFDAHPSLCQIGFDLIAEDIKYPPENQQWGILEGNTSANIPHHHYPVKGSPRNVTGAVLDVAIERKKVKCNLDVFFKSKGLLPAVRTEPKMYSKSVNAQSLLKQAAHNNGFQITDIDCKFWSIKKGKKKYFFVENMSEGTSFVSERLFNNRELTNKYIKSLEAPVPLLRKFSIEQLNEAWEFVQSLQCCTVKNVVRLPNEKFLEEPQAKEKLVEFAKCHVKNEFIIEEKCNERKVIIIIVSDLYFAAIKSQATNHKNEYCDFTDELQSDTIEQLFELKRKLPSMALAEFTLEYDPLTNFCSSSKSWKLVEVDCNPNISKYHFLASGVGRDIAGLSINHLQ